MISYDDILKITKQLLPSGRAWRLPDSGYFRKLLYAIGKSERRAYEFALSTLDRILPDNDNFTSSDASEWERRLNISSGYGYIPLETRKATILRKYQFPGGFLNRQNYRYIEAQLQLAGYSVTVTENYTPFATGTPTKHALTTLHSTDTRHGKADLIDDLIANSITKGEVFSVDTYKGCFYIDGTIPANSIPAFRQLVLTLKPVNTVAILRLTYTNEVELIYEGSPYDGENIYTEDLIQLIKE
jgi:uncharacterized protein YmfQ (DUF2313 family)